MWRNIFPTIQWIKDYSIKSLRYDAVSGLTLAAYAIPVSMAYATLAGLPPQYGIYGYLTGGLFYAIFGTGMQLSIGPTSAISLMIGTTIATMANGDVQRWAEIASLTALVVAIISIIAYLLRINSIINFISESVLLGFKAGAAITIALTQLPKLFGVKATGTGFFERSGDFLGHLPETNLPVLMKLRGLQYNHVLCRRHPAILPLLFRVAREPAMTMGPRMIPVMTFLRIIFRQRFSIALLPVACKLCREVMR